MSRPVTDELLGREAAEADAARFILGGRFGMEPAEVSSRRLDHFAEVGGRLVETAHSYAHGRSREVLGQWLRANPGTLGIVTKVGHDLQGEDIPLSREIVHEHVKESLASLGAGVLDVLLLHCDDPARSVAELADTLLSLVEAGYARRIGVSNWPADRLAALAGQLISLGQPPVASYHFSLADPDPAKLNPGNLCADDGIRAVIDQHRLPLFSWSAQARGFFARTESKRTDGPPDPFDTAENRVRRQRCAELADQLGCRSETVALAWTLHHPRIWPSIGPDTVEQLDQSLEAQQVPLTEPQIRWLRDGSP